MDKLPKVSIIISTKDRPELLNQCLKSLIKLRYENYEIIIVDNNSSSEETRLVANQFPVRYFLEKRPGQSAATNHGIRESRGAIIAITNDDCMVEENWLNVSVPNFSDPQVGCCTGKVIPIELKTKAQKAFESGWEHRNYEEKRIFSLKTPIRFFPIKSYVMGRGANMVFRKVSLENIGYFDEDLGVGSKARGGGEDLFALFQLIRKGHKVIYEPEAIVFHHHPREWKELKEKIFNYGFAWQSYLKKCYFAAPELRVEIIFYNLFNYMSNLVRLLKSFFHPYLLHPSLLSREIQGMIAGLLKCYRKSQ